MVKVAWKVKGNGRKAWKILREGVCDGCALGVAGFHDWTLDGVHLCTTRLRLLEVNCAEPFDHTVLGDVSWLRNLSSTDLRDLGRLAHPMRRRRGEPGFTPDLVGRGARRGRRRHPRRRRRPHGDLPHEPRHHQRGVLRRRQGGPGDGRRQHRLGRPHLPRPVDRRAQADDRRRRQHVLDAGRAGERPHRAVGHQRRQQPARVHQVPVPGPQAGRPGRRRQPVPRARARALLGAVERRVGAVRHQAVRPPRAGPPGGRRRPRQRRAAAPHRARRRRPTPGSPPTPRAGTSWPPTSPRSTGRRCSSTPASTTTRWSASSTCTPARRRPSSSGAWGSPSTPTASTACGRSSTSASPAATSAATAPG